MRKSFTLIELLIVIAILGALAAFLSGNYISSLKKGRDAKRKADLEQVQRALEMWYEDNRTYPLTASVTFGSSMVNGSKTYMQKIPKDPVSTRTYLYITDATRQTFQLYACLENELQILPFESTGYGAFACPTTCKAPDGTTGTTCVWGISDSSSSP